jgi:hypothetical protein
MGARDSIYGLMGARDGSAGIFGLSEHLDRLNRAGDPLEVLEATVGLESFRGWPFEGLCYGEGSKGERPPFDPVSMSGQIVDANLVPGPKQRNTDEEKAVIKDGKIVTEI